MDDELGDLPRKAMSDATKRWLKAGVVLGLAMIVVPFAASTIFIAGASHVPEGLRGATHIPEMSGKVDRAFSSVSFAAFLLPPGILLSVLSALALAEEQKRRSK